MKNYDLSKSLRAVALGLSLMALTLPVLAQNNNNNNAATTTTNNTTTTTRVNDNREVVRREEPKDDTDWGWLGLLGLAGLLGLMPKKRVAVPVVHETREVREDRTTPPPTGARR